MSRIPILATALIAIVPIVAAEPLPPGVVARLGDSKYRAAGAEYAMSPDGSLVAITEGGTSVRLVDVEKWSERQKLDPTSPPKELTERPAVPGYSLRVHHLRFSRDGKTLAAAINTGSNGYIAIWDVGTGKVLRTVPGFWPGFARSFAMSPDLRYSASYGDVRELGDRTANFSIRIRDNNANTLTTISVGQFNVDFLALSEDGTQIITWAAREQPPDRVKGKGPAPKAPGDSDLTGGRYELKIWDVATKKETVHFRIPKPPQEIAWSPNGECLAIRMGVLRNAERGIWDLKEGKFRSRFVCEESTGRAFFITNDAVGTVGLGGRFERRDAATGRLLDSVTGPGHEFEAMTFAAVLRADASVRICGRSGKAFAIWDVVAGEKKPVRMFGGFDGPCDAPVSLAFTPDGKVLRSLDRNGTLHSWDLASNRLEHTFHFVESPWSHGVSRRLHLTSDARYGLVFREQARVWDCETGKVNSHYPAHTPPSAIAFDGSFVPGVADAIQKVEALRPPTPGQLRQQSIASHDARFVVTLVERQPRQFGQPSEAELSVFDTSGMKVVSSTKLPRDPPRVFEFTPNEHQIVAVGSQNLVVWDWRESRFVCSVTNPGEAVPGFSPDGRVLARTLDASPTQKAGVEVREVASGTVRFVLPGGGRGAVAFSPDGKLLAAPAADGTILLWDVSPPKEAAKWAPSEADAIWVGLAVVDAGRGYERMSRLLANPDAAIQLIRERVKVTDARLDITRQVKQLDDDLLEIREAATRELGELGEPVAERLRKILEGRPSPEARRRIEFLLDDLTAQAHVAAIRPIRTIEVLERLDTPAARELLATFAKSAEETVLTREAKAALERSRPRKK